MTNAYLTVTNLNDPRLAALKHRVRINNAADRLARITENYTGSYKRERVTIYPRLGKNNPNRHLYAVGGLLHRSSSQRIRKEHGTRFDIYLNMEYVWRGPSQPSASAAPTAESLKIRRDYA